MSTVQNTLYTRTPITIYKRQQRRKRQEENEREKKKLHLEIMSMITGTCYAEWRPEKPRQKKQKKRIYKTLREKKKKKNDGWGQVLPYPDNKIVERKGRSIEIDSLHSQSFKEQLSRSHLLRYFVAAQTGCICPTQNGGTTHVVDASVVVHSCLMH